MSPRRRCPGCGKEGFVRIERVIKAGKGMSLVVCTVCAQKWEEVDEPPDGDQATRRADSR